MDTLLRTVLIVGVLNLIALGLIACGDDSKAEGTLADRVAELETWKLSVEQRLVDANNARLRQEQFNVKVDTFVSLAREHAASVDKGMESQRRALDTLGEIAKDLLARK